MHTVQDILSKSQTFLENQGLTESRLKAELLLSKVLSLPRLELYLNHAKPLHAAEVAKVRKLLARLANKEPLQYILGEAWFMGLCFKADQRALIPRFDTELLVEAVISSISQDAAKQVIIDVGTGSGCIAISLAKNLKDARIIGLDKSELALELARENAHLHQQQIEFYKSDLLSHLPADLAQNDGIWLVSNPPYITSAEFEKLPSEIKNHEPREALNGGLEGLDYYQELLKQAKELKRAKLALEIGFNQKDQVKKLILQYFPDYHIDIKLDGQQYPRVVMAYKV